MPMPSHLAVVLSHVAFENLGSLEAPLRDRGFAIETVDVATARFPLPQAESCDLLVALGGPIGVYDRLDYPFLTGEIACIAMRLAARRPVLGICLGAQLMAAALGARVYPGDHGAEIGWEPIAAAPARAIRRSGLPRCLRPDCRSSIGTVTPSISHRMQFLLRRPITI